MRSHWKKYFVRHSLFVYSRDTLLFFVNLFAWNQSKDLKVIALFNIIYLSAHTSMFFIALPALKKSKSQLLMRTSVFGLALVLAAILLLGEQTINHIYSIGFFLGIFNGMYWLVNHVESLDIATNSNRTSFFSYRIATQGVAKLAVPGVGWLMFTLFGNTNAGYSAVFSVALVALVFAWHFTDVAQREESKLKFKESMRELRQTKHFGLLQLNAFMYGVSIRSALAVILLPFLIFQVVENESSLSMIQTIIQILAILAAAYFAGHKKNTNYITKLFFAGGAASMIGLVSLYLNLSLATYLIYIVTYIIALSAINVGLATMSNNYVSTVKNHDKHRMEFIAIREPAALSGFIVGYVFVYFNPNLNTESIRPLLIFTIIATMLNIAMSVYLWLYVKKAT